MRIAVGGDHGGWRLKEEIIALLQQKGIAYQDFGTFSPEAVDYPDFALKVAEAVRSGEYDRGILCCGTGIGVAIAANKVPGIRAALCHDTFSARAAREHNNANILTLGERVIGPGLAKEIVETWLKAEFQGGRHARRVEKIARIEEKYQQRKEMGMGRKSFLDAVDPEIARALALELERQQNTLELIASENSASLAVMEAQGSILTNKYAEGYPGRRYYGGCQFVDIAEQLAIDRAKKLFGAEHANVQPHSGTEANLAVYLALLKPGDTILGMNLAHGGHLTHGSPLNMSGKYFQVVFYGVEPDSGLINYEKVLEIARQAKPRLIVAGASAYPRAIDFARFQEIARAVGAYLMVDMAHIAGLVAAGEHMSPIPYADVVTTTTHKTLRGPRGGMILCRQEFAAAIDKAVFPGIQGGPLMHVIAAKAVALHEALQPEFREYQRQIVKNARRLARALQSRGFALVGGGTDNHLLLVDLRNKGITGKQAETLLDEVGITVNKNAIPYDPQPPAVASGIRIGTPAVTTRGLDEEAMEMMAEAIHCVLSFPEDRTKQAQAGEMVQDLCRRYPLYEELE